MSGRIFLIECRRNLRLSLALMIGSALIGFTAFSALNVKRYIHRIFVPVKWQADLILLPKGVTPEGVQRSLLHGQPEGLMPLTLLETLQAQVNQEVMQKRLSRPPFVALGFIPFRDREGKTQVAYVGDRDAYFAGAEGDTVWARYPWVKWDEVKTDLASREGYFTPEWSGKVLMGVLVRGDAGPIERLKELIDRRTVAQGVRVKAGASDLELRVNELNRALAVLMALIFLCLLPGLGLAILLLGERRRAVLEVLREIGFAGPWRARLVTLQIVFLIVVPILIGAATAGLTAPWTLNLLKFS